MGNLYIVATPIGNLRDITLRSLEVLKSVDVVLAEDTRVARRLLSHYRISKHLLRFDEHARDPAMQKILELLKSGKTLALVADAGTPGISDPGQRLFKFLVSRGWQGKVIPIPGPSSLSAMLSVSDIDVREFSFLGFPPRKRGRRGFFQNIAKSEVPVILFESPHRISKTIKELYDAAGERYLNIGRELTKIHEEILRGPLSEAVSRFKGQQKGEFVLIIDFPRG